MDPLYLQGSGGLREGCPASKGLWHHPPRPIIKWEWSYVSVGGVGVAAGCRPGAGGRGTGRERVALQRSGLVSERRAPWWGSGGRVRPGWEAGFSKCPIPGSSRAPAHLSFCRMSCRISGFPMFPGKSAGEDLTQSPPSVGCPPVLRHSAGDAP